MKRFIEEVSRAQVSLLPECQRNLELMWLSGRLAPDFKTIADFRTHGKLRARMEQQLREVPDGQVSLTDPEARSMATSVKGTGVVGYNVQMAVDTRHHLIVAHEVTNVGTLPAPSQHGNEPAGAGLQLMSIFGVSGAMEALRA